MSYARVETLAVTCDGSGAATVFTGNVTGLLSQIRYVKNNFANGSTITFTNEVTGEAIWAQTGVNASVTVAPRQPLHDTVGGAALFAAGGTAQAAQIAIAGHRVKLVISGGGANTTGTFFLVFN